MTYLTVSHCDERRVGDVDIVDGKCFPGAHGRECKVSPRDDVTICCRHGEDCGAIRQMLRHCDVIPLLLKTRRVVVDVTDINGGCGRRWWRNKKVNFIGQMITVRKFVK